MKNELCQCSYPEDAKYGVCGKCLLPISKEYEDDFDDEEENDDHLDMDFIPDHWEYSPDSED